MVAVGMPKVCGPHGRACGRIWAHEVDRHAECSHHLRLINAARDDRGAESAGGEQRRMCQILAKLTYYKCYNFDMACFSLPSLACNKAWGLAKTASVINFINQQARLLIVLAGLILTIQTF